jgi:hypothetical protein
MWATEGTLQGKHFTINCTQFTEFVICLFQAKRLHEAFHQPFLINKKKIEKTGAEKSKS